ncbi:MAG TPA: CCA tRNA nucleotidyltransferase, partial [Bacillota bacterium]|nr:CCA tRNA nucleotidyltransferase [Bacillota bacterium]
MPSTFSKAIKVIQHIEKKGFNAYFVGGCVRDLIIGRPVGDIDIATSAKPFDIQHIFRKVIPVGIEHGTVIVRWEGDSFEVTTFRLENTYSDQRHPDNVTFVQTIDQDLKRRDFTMNAIAMDKTGNIVDPYGGKKDIEHRQIRAVGNGYDRFHEDPLRIIRAVRFSSQLGFTIEKHTLNDMLKVRDQIRHLAVERLTVEITKLFAGDFIDKGMSYLNKTRILNELPIFKEH